MTAPDMTPGPVAKSVKDDIPMSSLNVGNGGGPVPDPDPTGETVTPEGEPMVPTVRELREEGAGPGDAGPPIATAQRNAPAGQSKGGSLENPDTRDSPADNQRNRPDPKDNLPEDNAPRSSAARRREQGASGGMAAGDFVHYVTPNGHHAALITHVYGPDMVDLLVFPDTFSSADGFGADPIARSSVGSDENQETYWRKIR